MKAVDLLALAYQEGACMSATMCLTNNISHCPSLKAHEYFAFMKRAHKAYSDRTTTMWAAKSDLIGYWSYKEKLRGCPLQMTEYECAFVHSWILWSFSHLLEFENDSEFAELHKQLWDISCFKKMQNLAAALVRAYSEE